MYRYKASPKTMQSLFSLFAAALLYSSSSFCQAFASGSGRQHQPRDVLFQNHRSVQTTRPVRVMMIDPSTAVDAMVMGSNSLLIAETEAWVQPAVLVLDPFLNLMSFAMLARIVLSWYPDTIQTDSFPWISLVVAPTEPLLRAVKGFVPPAFGVDITPVFWLAIFTFMHEILLGQQGLLTMKIKYGI